MSKPRALSAFRKISRGSKLTIADRRILQAIADEFASDRDPRKLFAPAAKRGASHDIGLTPQHVAAHFWYLTDTEPRKTRQKALADVAAYWRLSEGYIDKIKNQHRDYFDFYVDEIKMTRVEFLAMLDRLRLNYVGRGAARIRRSERVANKSKRI